MTNPRLPSLRPREVLRALERAGFWVHRQTGSHLTLKHATDPTKRVTVPFHARELPRWLLGSILKQAGLTPEEFLRLL